MTRLEGSSSRDASMIPITELVMEKVVHSNLDSIPDAAARNSRRKSRGPYLEDRGQSAKDIR